MNLGSALGVSYELLLVRAGKDSDRTGEGERTCSKDPVSHNSLSQASLSPSLFLAQGGTAGICRVCRFGSSPLSERLGQL